jgi:GR25 family glycosyltransferase involved in LPS biosynthesis
MSARTPTAALRTEARKFIVEIVTRVKFKKMRLNYIYKRLYNGIGLRYSIIEIFSLVLFRGIYSRLNRLNVAKVEAIKKIDISTLNVMVISLQDRKDRRAVIYKALSLNKLPFKFIDGIHGKLIMRNRLNVFFSAKSIKHLSNGSIGCIMTHIKAYRSIIKSNAEYSLILEDDVILNDGFYSKLQQLMTSLPDDFDIVYLASNFSIKNNLRACLSDTLYVPLYPRSGQYAYLISNKGAKQIMNNIFPIRISLGGIDTLIGRLVSRRILIAYHVVENLCSVEYNNESNVVNESRKGKKIHQTEYYG